MQRVVPGLVGLTIILALMAPAYASPGTATLSGGGTGHLLCGTSGILPATIAFSASTTGGAVSGSYTISVPTFSGPQVVISGTIMAGKIGSQSYDVTGSEIMNSCNPPPFTGSSFSAIEGRCGASMTISYEITEHPGVDAGAFTGTAKCT